MIRSSILFGLLALPSALAAFEYRLTNAGAISCTDVSTGIGDISTLFNGEAATVHVDGLEWESTEYPVAFGSDRLYWKTYVGDQLQASGEYDLSTFGRQLPTELDVGNVSVEQSGSHTISVVLIGSGFEEETSRTYQSYAAAVSIIPLIVVLILAMATQMVEFSLFTTVFIGACMVTGEIKAGFQSTLDTYILENLADVDHAYVYLFSLFLSGLVAMMQKSGGMIGFTQWIAQYAKNSRAAQVAIFCVTCLCFFDDYTNLLLTGQSMSALSDVLMVSKEKFTFLVDATAAPLASLTPVSSWVGFEVSLIQQELDALVRIHGEENLTVSTSAINVFIQSIKYRYYPLFMLFLIPTLLVLQRDFGPMLYAERRCRVYERTDGGDGKISKEESGKVDSGENQPRKDIPYSTWNMLVPVLLLIFFIFFLMIRTGSDGTGTQSFTDKIENSDSFSALLWGTMATAILTSLMYAFQITQDGSYVMPSWPVIQSCLLGGGKDDSDTVEENQEELPVKMEEQALLSDSASRPRSLMSLYECVEAFLFGMGRLFPALIVLTLAWATGTVMTTVGADRFFSRIITEGVAAEAMPTLAFVISVMMALATGSSWSTMTILFPLIMVPTYQVSDGDEIIFYSTVAGILSGSVAGDHISPLSDTTVISAMSCGCKLLNHVMTQAPYSAVVVVFCILFGTIPIGNGAMPNIVGIVLGGLAIALFVYFVGAPIVNPTGKYDLITELVMKCRPNTELEALREDTVRYHSSPEADADAGANTDNDANDWNAQAGEAEIPSGFEVEKAEESMEEGPWYIITDETSEL